MAVPLHHPQNDHPHHPNIAKAQKRRRSQDHPKRLERASEPHKGRKREELRQKDKNDVKKSFEIIEIACARRRHFLFEYARPFYLTPLFTPTDYMD